MILKNFLKAIKIMPDESILYYFIDKNMLCSQAQNMHFLFPKASVKA